MFEPGIGSGRASPSASIRMPRPTSRGISSSSQRRRVERDSQRVRRARMPEMRSSIPSESARRRARLGSHGRRRPITSWTPISAIASPNGVDRPKNGIAISVSTPTRKPKPASAALSTSSPTVSAGGVTGGFAASEVDPSPAGAVDPRGCGVEVSYVETVPISSCKSSSSRSRRGACAAMVSRARSTSPGAGSVTREPYSRAPVSASLPISRNSIRIARSRCSWVRALPSSAARKAARRAALRM